MLLRRTKTLKHDKQPFSYLMEKSKTTEFKPILQTDLILAVIAQDVFDNDILLSFIVAI